VINLSVNPHVLIVTGISIAVGAGLAAVLMVVGNRVVVPMPILGIGAAVLLVTVMGIAIEHDPILGTVIWGGMGGFMLVPSVLPWKGTGIAGQ
jgi:hypothetical protein